MRQRLVEMLNDKIVSSHKTGRMKTTYDSPNWSLLQADARGYERALEEVIDLISENLKDEQEIR